MPEPVSLFVLYDADRNKSFWASSDQELTGWHRIALGDDRELESSELFQPDSPEPLWLSPAAGITVAAPSLELIEADSEQQVIRLIH